MKAFFVLGSLYDAEVESLTESTHDPNDPKAVAHSCFIVAAIYGVLLVSCGFQAWLNLRNPPDAEIRDRIAARRLYVNPAYRCGGNSRIRRLGPLASSVQKEAAVTMNDFVPKIERSAARDDLQSDVSCN
ncbi:hypothetical protein BC937DRAFT_91296 [Endogone sp. FLAS-F59071]|nr:hypothetical protein BC937DRAFT_91296 [Endogone sp. FLAS-F59071]|eukprot:RUS16363.1 hypothetical protein BC937DRAFT_91296 [Endogone sp. FLAS-F59071]